MVRWTTQPYAKLRAGGDDVPYKEVRVINPSRGLNLLVADVTVNDKEATAGTKNIQYTEGGAAQKRMGYTQVAATAALSNSATGIGKYMSESVNHPIAADGGVLKKYQLGTWTALPGSVTVDLTQPTSFTSLYQKTYAWDKTNGGVVYDGTSVTRPGTMPKAEASVNYKGYHVAFGAPGQPFRLFFAPASDPSRFTRAAAPTDPADVALNDATNVPGATVFTGDNSPRAIDIDKNNGEIVTGLGFFQDLLIVFKESSIYQLSFNDANGFVVQRITSSYGAVCHGAIASVENDCYFLTEKGVYVLGNEPNYYAAIRTNELSSRIQPLMLAINPAQYRRCRAVYYQDRYYLSVPMNSNTRNNAVIVYDRRFYAWSYWDNINANDFLIFKNRDVDNITYFYFTDAKTAKLHQFTPGQYNDNGVAIEAVFRTRAYEGGAMEKEKYWYTIRPIFRLTTGNVQVSFVTENGSAGKPASVSAAMTGGLGVDEFGGLMWGSSQQDTYTDVDLGLVGTSIGDSSSVTDNSNKVFDIGVGIDSRTLKAEFRNNGLNETFTILGWIILFQVKDVDRFDGGYTIR